MGRKARDGERFRPLLRLSATDKAKAEALGVEELARMVAWALPLWQSRKENEAPRPDFDKGTTILRPMPALGKEPASLWYDPDGRVLCCVRPVRDRRFWELVTGQGLEWSKANERYERKLNKMTGAPLDRVAELATILYKQGWPVALGSQEIVDLVVEARWIPEQKRWVQMLTGGDLLLTWEKGGDDVYRATEHLPSAKWSKRLQGTIVPAKYAYDVRDFAEQWNFAVTAKALAVLESAVDQSPPELLGIKLPDTLAQPARKRQKPELVEDQGEVSIPAHLRFEN